MNSVTQMRLSSTRMSKGTRLPIMLAGTAIGFWSASLCLVFHPSCFIHGVGFEGLSFVSYELCVLLLLWPWKATVPVVGVFVQSNSNFLGFCPLLSALLFFESEKGKHCRLSKHNMVIGRPVDFPMHGLTRPCPTRASCTISRMALGPPTPMPKSSRIR